MKNYLLIALLAAGTTTAFAQGPARLGQAGSMELMINAWSRSAGFNNLNIATTQGIEAVGLNPAGTAINPGTEVILSRTDLLIGSDMAINSLGFCQKVGGDGALGLFVNSFDAGKFIRTTQSNPDGEDGTYRLNVTTLGANYAKKFTDAISVGTTIKVSNTSTNNLSATAVAVDAGIQYRTGEEAHPERIKFGISLRNVGPLAKFGGQGLDDRVTLQSKPYKSAVAIPTSTYELPTCLSISGSYDFYFAGGNEFTLMGTFISHAFAYSQYGVGAEFRYKQYLQLRGGYVLEKGQFGTLGVERYNVYTGPSFGGTLQLPVATGKTAAGQDRYSDLALDFGYRTTNPYRGTFNLGLRLSL